MGLLDWLQGKKKTTPNEKFVADSKPKGTTKIRGFEGDLDRTVAPPKSNPWRYSGTSKSSSWYDGSPFTTGYDYGGSSDSGSSFGGGSSDSGSGGGGGD